MPVTFLGANSGRAGELILIEDWFERVCGSPVSLHETESENFLPMDLSRSEDVLNGAQHGLGFWFTPARGPIKRIRDSKVVNYLQVPFHNAPPGNLGCCDITVNVIGSSGFCLHSIFKRRLYYSRP